MKILNLIFNMTISPLDKNRKVINDVAMDEKLKMELKYLALQAKWTRPMRIQLYRRADLIRRGRILDVGCSDGLITAEIAKRTGSVVVGVDILNEAIERARENHPEVEFRIGDFMELPFRKKSFDAVITSFTLLWVERPGQALNEAMRVLKKGGIFLALGEPDYGGRLDWPEGLSLKEFWVDAITAKGGDPHFGRKLKSHLVAAGLKNVEVGVHSSIWTGDGSGEAVGDDLDVYLDDLGRCLTATGVDAKPIIREERRAIESGGRLVFMPIFWGMGER